MTRPHSRPPGLCVEQLEDRLTPAGTMIPAGEFNWMQYGPTGELGELVWQGQTLVYRERVAGGWTDQPVVTAGTYSLAQYDSRDQVERATASAQLVFTSDGTPHVLYLDPTWNGSANAYQTVIRDYARVGGRWQLVESVTAPWLSPWGPRDLVAEAGPNNSLHLLFTETYTAATGVGNEGSGILWYATNKSGAWTFDKVSGIADPRQDVWFTGGRWAPRFLSLAVDAQNHAYVTYTPEFYVSGAFGTVNSKLAFATNRSGTWQSSEVYAPPGGTGDAGLGASVAVSPTGQVAIASYYVNRFSTGSPQWSQLMYHTQKADGTWTHSVVVGTPDGYVAGDGAKFTGFSPQLFFDASGRPNILFTDEAAQHNPVSYANQAAGQIRLATLANGSWSVQTLVHQNDPLVNQLFYPVAATYHGQLTVGGLVAVSSLDGNQNPTDTNFNLMDLGAPAGQPTPTPVSPPPPPAAPIVSLPVTNSPPSAPAASAASTPAAMAVANDAQPGVTTTVTVFRSDGSADFTITPFGTDYSGGARVVRADVTGDGVPDIIVGSGGGIQARVRIWDGATHNLIFDTTPFEGFTGGVVVAAGNLTGGKTQDVILAPDAGGGPRIQVWTGGTFTKLIPDFFGLPYPDFRGGLRIAAGDLNRDGVADLIVAPGSGGGPRITVYDGRSLDSAQGPKPLVNDFFAFDPSLRTGLFLAAGDVNGDGYADIVVGSGVGGSPRVVVISGADLMGGRVRSLADFYAANAAERNGVRVGVTAAGPDGRTDILTGTGGAELSVYAVSTVTSSATPTPLEAFPVFGGVSGGVYVG
ncbi:MAG: repeat protein [Gemmataceae bacterium]|nr:repeat protein [Gemmataceae bacterium]